MTEQSQVTKRIIVNGKVQGVFFRAYTRTRANRLGITGWVRNKPDGDVEVVATGTQAKLDLFIKWLHVGSPMSAVKSVSAADESLTSMHLPLKNNAVIFAASLVKLPKF